MTRPRIYIDRSVFGGICDDEYAETTRRFLDRVGRGAFVVLLSPLTIEELEPAPDRVRCVLEVLPEDGVETLDITDETEALAQAYIDGGALGEAARMDARHVAAATLGGADIIVSWNFKHLVRFDRIRMFNGVNALRGYRAIDIRCPKEMGDEDEDI